MLGAQAKGPTCSSSGRASGIAFDPHRLGVRHTAAGADSPGLSASAIDKGAIDKGDFATVTPHERQDFVSLFSLSQPRTAAYATLKTLRILDNGRVPCGRFARPAKAGERHPIQLPIAEVVYADLRRRSAEHETTVSRLAADLLAIVAGHPELAREFGPVTLCLPCRLADTIAMPIGQPAMGTRIRTEVSVPGPVHAAICDCARQNAGDTELVAADLLAIATGHPGGIRHLNQTEMRRLAGESLVSVNGVGVTRCAE